MRKGAGETAPLNIVSNHCYGVILPRKIVIDALGKG
jgi:hypothetical protein